MVRFRKQGFLDSVQNENKEERLINPGGVWCNFTMIDHVHMVKGCGSCALTHLNIMYTHGIEYILMPDPNAIKVIKDSPYNCNIIHLLEPMFSVHSYPTVLISINATIFHNYKYHSYCKTRGIFQYQAVWHRTISSNFKILSVNPI